MTKSVKKSPEDKDTDAVTTTKAPEGPAQDDPSTKGPSQEEAKVEADESAKKSKRAKKDEKTKRS